MQLRKLELNESELSSKISSDATSIASSEMKDPVRLTLVEIIELVKAIPDCYPPVLAPHVDNLASKLLVKRRSYKTIEQIILPTFKVTYEQLNFTYYRLPYEPYYLDPRTNQMVILSDQKAPGSVDVQKEIILVKSEKDFLAFYARHAKTKLLKELGFFGKGISSLDQMKGLEFVELNSSRSTPRRCA